MPGQDHRNGKVRLHHLLHHPGGELLVDAVIGAPRAVDKDVKEDALLCKPRERFFERASIPKIQGDRMKGGMRGDLWICLVKVPPNAVHGGAVCKERFCDGLSDPGGGAGEKYGLSHAVPPSQKKIFAPSHISRSLPARKDSILPASSVGYWQ